MIETPCVFLEGSLRTLQVCLWTDLNQPPKVLSVPLTSTSPLSTLMPEMWARLGVEFPQFGQELKSVYMCSGPGSLTALRVLFAYTQGLWAVFPKLNLFLLPTPVWLSRVCVLAGSSAPRSFLFQVGRFAFIRGTCEDVSSYESIRIGAEDEASKSGIDDLDLVVSPKQLCNVDLESSIWLEGTQSIRPVLIRETLADFSEITKLSDLKPIQLDS